MDWAEQVCLLASRIPDETPVVLSNHTLSSDEVAWCQGWNIRDWVVTEKRMGKNRAWLTWKYCTGSHPVTLFILLFFDPASSAHWNMQLNNVVCHADELCVRMCVEGAVVACFKTWPSPWTEWRHWSSYGYRFLFEVTRHVPLELKSLTSLLCWFGSREREILPRLQWRCADHHNLNRISPDHSGRAI
jgi:hypothetical protein